MLLQSYPAAATARFTITITITMCARYSALAWMSMFRTSWFCLTAATASGDLFLERASSEDYRAGAGDGDAHIRLGDEHADHRVARGRIRELHVGGHFRHRKGHRNNDFAGLQRRLEHAGKEVVGLEFAAVGADRRIERNDGAGIVGRWIVGDRAADRAAIANGGIADMGS